MQQYKDWIIGVIIEPARTFGEIYENKPVGPAIITYIIALILSSLASSVLDPGIAATIGASEVLGMITDAAMSLGIGVIGAFLIHLTARFMFGGKGLFWNFFTCYLFTATPLILAAPILIVFSLFGLTGYFAGAVLSIMVVIWLLALLVIAIRESYSLTTWSGIAVIVILIVIAIVIIFTLISIFMALI